ncbi:hypothetical protein ACQ4M4_24575 [Leptolyngbya sp. AN02str]|uniref:hypothetical protein n=1 Tax=Leptolyngbya sp. AN02str TaxID=3423363 RepID=UPI003D31D51F
MTRNHHPSQSTTKRFLPTRRELIDYLKAKGKNPDALTRMNTWEQIQLTSEYQQTVQTAQ